MQLQSFGSRSDRFVSADISWAARLCDFNLEQQAGAGSLESIAQLLNDNPGVSVIVVGNADTLGIASGFKDNWSLSTERANTIVRVLRDKYKIEPSRIISAGRSRYDPIADNSTKDGRKMNRRTDIIINPDQSKLWQIVDGAKK